MRHLYRSEEDIVIAHTREEADRILLDTYGHHDSLEDIGGPCVEIPDDEIITIRCEAMVPRPMAEGVIAEGARPELGFGWEPVTMTAREWANDPAPPRILAGPE